MKKSELNFLLVTVLILLLVVIGVLQYRLIGQTSDSEFKRTKEKARVATENFSRDFDRELTRAFLQLLVDPISFSRKDWGSYALRYENWSATAPYPKLVENVFIAEKNADGRVVLFAYNEATNRFEETMWLPQLARVQSEIARDLDGAADGIQKNIPSEMIAPDVPALVIPVPAVNFSKPKNGDNDSKPGESINIDSNRHAGYTIVLLNLDFIKGELLPSLAARYFGDAGTEESNYDLVVTNRTEPSQMIYHTDSSPMNAEMPIESDIQVDLFTLRFSEIESLLPAAPRRQSESSKTTGKKPKTGNSVGVVVSPPVVVTGSTAQTDAPLGSQKAGWRLFARYRSGSLESGIESVRSRNLIASFGVLLLLAANGVLLIILLNKSQKLAEQQTNFLTNVTHELRTPLAVIRATSENISDGIIDDAAQIKEYGLIINTEERRLTSMIEQVLEFAGARNVKNNGYNYRPENVAEIIEAALKDYRIELKESDFQIILEIEPDLPEIFADREALRRVVGNLIGNAIKYGDPGIDERRQIKINARKIQNKSSKQIEISVKDNGAGIEKKDLPNIFKLFYRGRMATENQIKGSGIGLSLVKQTVEAHGGTVSVVSTLNHGSTFKLLLPTLDDEATSV